MRKHLLFFLLSAIAAGAGLAQEQQPRQMERTPMDQYSFEEIFIAGDSNGVRLNVHYRIRHDFFIFTLSAARQNEYSAQGEVSSEILDSAGTSVARKFHSLDLHAADNALSFLRRQYVEGSMSFSLMPGKYSLLTSIEDRESKRASPNFPHPLIVPRYGSSSPFRSSILIVKSDSRDTNEYPVVNLGGNAHFGSDIHLAFVIQSGATRPSFSYRIRKASQREEERTTVQRDTNLAVSFIPDAVFSMKEVSNGTVIYSSAPNPGTGIISCTIPATRLKQGRYDVTISMTSPDTASVTKEITLRWLDMPVSLTDIDLAVIAMRYITTDDEFSDLQSGNKATRIKKFEEFWEKRDPTPETAYNERMAEYFRRVDYAAAAFRTLKEENGVLTDRGKIFILYGKPTSTERTLAPNSAPRELWKYDALKKQFLFEDPTRQGNYKLIATEPQ